MPSVHKEPLRNRKRTPVQTPCFCCCSLSCSVKPSCFRAYRQVSFQGKFGSFLLVYTNLISHEVHFGIHFLFLHTPCNFDLGSLWLCPASPDSVQSPRRQMMQRLWPQSKGRVHTLRMHRRGDYIFLIPGSGIQNKGRRLLIYQNTRSGCRYYL